MIKQSIKEQNKIKEVIIMKVSVQLFKKIYSVIGICVVLLTLAQSIHAQVWLKGKVINLNNKGIIPNGQSAVTSLTIGGDGLVYGGTSSDKLGKEAYLFRYSGSGDYTEALRPLSPEIPGQQKIWHSLVTGSDGNIYGGTWNGGDLYREAFGPKENLEDQPSGHLFQYNIKTGAIKDLGIVSNKEGIYVLRSNKTGDILYGITTPGCLLFSYNISNGKLRIIGDVMSSIKSYLNPSDKEYKFKITDVGESAKPGWEKSIGGAPWQKRYFPPRDIICDDKGNVWGSRDQGYLFKYDVEKDKIIETEIQIPIMIGTEDGNITEISVDALSRDHNGMIYGGTTSDGYLFRFNPNTGEVIGLGKPIRQSRIRSLSFGKDGFLYGIGGENTYISQVFRYNPENGDLRELGVIHERGWTIYNIEVLIVSPNGDLYFGEKSRIGHLIKIEKIEYMPVLGA
jgi:hypothetical protein